MMGIRKWPASPLSLRWRSDTPAPMPDTWPRAAIGSMFVAVIDANGTQRRCRRAA